MMLENQNITAEDLDFSWAAPETPPQEKPEAEKITVQPNINPIEPKQNITAEDLDFSWAVPARKDDDKDITPTVRTQPNESDKVTFEQLASDKNYMTMLREYQENRFGEEGKQDKDESNEEYVKRFLSHVREFEFNTIDLGQQLNWVREAKPEMRRKFGLLYSEIEKAPSFWEEGGTSVASAIRDYGAALITDPFSYLGFGAGSIARIAATRAVTKALQEGGKRAAVEEAKKYGITGMLKTKPGLIATSGIVGEAGVGSVQSLALQEAKVLSDMQDKVSGTEAAVVGGLGLVLGAAGVAASRGINSKDVLRKARKLKIERDKLGQEYARREKGFVETATSLAAEANKPGTGSGVIFDTKAGRDVLDELGDVPDENDFVAQVQFKKELMKRISMVATDLAEDLARSGKLSEIVTEDMRASEVVGALTKIALKAADDIDPKTATKSDLDKLSKQTRDLIMGGEEGQGGFLSTLKVEDVNLKGALQRAGLTTKQFVDAMGATVSDSAAVMGSLGRMGKVIKDKLKGMNFTDREIKDLLGETGGTSLVQTPFASFYDGLKNLDRNRRSLMVTQVATTVRNVATGTIRLPMMAAADAIESSIYHIGKALNAARTGQIEKGTSLSYKDIIRDSFKSAYRIASITKTADLSDALLKHNPVLSSRINRTLQESSDQEGLWWLSEKLNGLNIAQDIVFRRAIFTHNIDKAMRRAGVITDNPTKINQFKNIEEFAASGKRLPDKVLQNAVEEALYFTFSRMPKQGSKSSKIGDSIGYGFVKTIENLPFTGTAIIPFPRFMVNALQFQFEYSPASLFNGAYKYGLAKFKGMNDPQMTENLLTQSRREVSKGVVGTAALIAAIKYRSDNPDIKWYEYKKEDGSTADLRPLFPLAPYLAIAELIAGKAPVDTEEVIAGITGLQARTGASNYILDKAFEIFRKEDDLVGTKIGRIAGGFVGEIFGSYFTPARVIRDVQAAYDTEAARVRASNAYKGLGFGDAFFEAVNNKLVKDIPGMAKALPAAESPTRESDIFRRSPLVGQFLGVRTEAPRNVVEREMVKFGIKSYEISPKTGDKEADNIIKSYLGKEVESSVAEYVNSEDYQKATKNQRKAKLLNMLNTYKKISTALAKHEIDLKERKTTYSPFDQAEYFKLRSIMRNLVEDWYQEKYGKSVVQMQKENPNVNHFQEATSLAKALYSETITNK
ncbi:MAG: hypothetical protein VW739_01325 [Pelagibacteraceae bacterium]